jgi:hypothetical protein
MCSAQGITGGNMSRDLAKRYFLACFEYAQPLYPESDGDAYECFDTLGQMEVWLDRAMKAGRFKLFVLWDGISGEWEWVDDFTSPPRLVVPKRRFFPIKRVRSRAVPNAARKSHPRAKRKAVRQKLGENSPPQPIASATCKQVAVTT